MRPDSGTDEGQGVDLSIRKVVGRGVPLRGDSIDTDRILPARYLRCVTFEGLEQHVFEDDRKAAGGRHPFDDPRYRGASVLIVGANFGCGSSREHAPQGLQRWGIRALLGRSFAEIFFGNCVALGVPCLRLAPRDLDRLLAIVEELPTTELTVDLEARAVVVRRPGAGVEAFPAEIVEGARESFLRGTWDATAALLAGNDQVAAVARALPYTGGFAP